MNSFKIGPHLMTFDQPKIMGVLNLTPDSFYDGGRFNNIDAACQRVSELLKDGADIIDVGAFSSRPEAQMISAEEEIRRLEEPFKQLVKAFPDAVFSIDTYRYEVVNKLSKYAAFIVNDITGFKWDDNLVQTVGQLNFPYVLMHMQGSPVNMQDNPQYANILEELIIFFTKKISQLKRHGIDQLLIDPGFGFGKTIDHNYQLLAKLELFKIFDHPILVGLSRKSMIYKVLNTNAENALNGTTALHMIALQNGARILRVHDVKEALETVTLWQRMRDSVKN